MRPPADGDGGEVVGEQRVGQAGVGNLDHAGLGRADAVDVDRHAEPGALLGGLVERQFAGAVLPVGDEDDRGRRVALPAGEQVGEGVGQGGARLVGGEGGQLDGGHGAEAVAEQISAQRPFGLKSIEQGERWVGEHRPDEVGPRGVVGLVGGAKVGRGVGGGLAAGDGDALAVGRRHPAVLLAHALAGVEQHGDGPRPLADELGDEHWPQ